MLVTLYTSRIILNTLGVDDFGIYNVVGGVVTMFAFFNSAMSSATQRFLSIEIGKGDYVQLRKTFNAAQIIHIGIAILIFILAETIGLWILKTYLVIPADRLQAALWVYHFSVLSFMVSVVQVPYNATIIAHERMNVYAYVSIIEVILKLLIVFMLTWITFDKLKLYGILLFIVVLVIAAIYRVYTRKNFEESKFEVVKDFTLYKTLISFSSWNLFGNIAVIAKGQGVNILLNIFFGPTVNAARGIATQVQSAVLSFVTNFQTAVNPQIIKSYASNNLEYMNSLIIKSSKISFYLLFLITLPILLEVDQILKLWLKIVPDYTPTFTILILILILINSVSGPLMTAAQATGNIKIYQIVVGTLQFLILPISYLFLKLGYSPEISLYIAIFIEVIALFFRLIFLKRMMNFPFRLFLKEVINKNILIFILASILPLIIKNSIDMSIARLFIVITISMTWTLIIEFFIGFNKKERLFILSNIKKIHR